MRDFGGVGGALSPPTVSGRSGGPARFVTDGLSDASRRLTSSGRAAIAPGPGGMLRVELVSGFPVQVTPRLGDTAEWIDAVLRQRAPADCASQPTAPARRGGGHRRQHVPTTSVFPHLADSAARRSAAMVATPAPTAKPHGPRADSMMSSVQTP